MFKPDLVKVAITAAGGRNRVAEHFGFSKQTISLWSHYSRVSPHHIEPLCALGQYIVRPEQLLAYIDWARKEKK
jgi:hypothetical protein